MASRPSLALAVAGGPAPGINGVIAAATIEARNRGVPVLGVMDGFRWLERGDTEHVIPLETTDVSRIHFRGGSILRTARDNPTKSAELLENVLHALLKLRVRWFVTIGGDDTAYTAAQLARVAEGQVSCVHVPKTIDNDLPLPGGVPTFGFETARHFGVSIVERIMEDARTTSRWYILVAMGRKAGHLALGIGKAAGAPLVLIPEEFGDAKLRLETLADLIEGSIIKRRALGQENGVAILAEGLAERLDPTELAGIGEAERDDHGHVRLSELPLGPALKNTLKQRFAGRGIGLKLVAKDIGYELRCADPIPFDSEYTRDLGFGAVRAVLAGQNEVMISRQDGRIVPIPFEEMTDPATGRTRVRYVDVNSESYQVARKYMLRLEAEELRDDRSAAALARAAGVPVADLRARFG